jgi:glutaryl-CoA dehydrogenase (non-decarboxylating)
MSAIREFVEAELRPRADEYDAAGALPRELIAQLSRNGWLGAALSPRWGGGGWDALAVGRLHAEVGRACGSTRSLFTVQTMVGLALERWGRDGLKQRFLPDMASGARIAALALSEAGAGSDIQGIATRATRQGDGYLLQGTKRWSSFGQIADLFLVFARIEDGMGAFLVEGSAPGLHRKPVAGLLGLRASQLADLELDGCFVPGEHVLRGGQLPISPVADHALEIGRFSVAWGCLGLAEACLEASLAHTRERVQSGRPLQEHQLVARHLTDMIVGVRATRLLCEQAAERRAAGDLGAGVAASIAKYQASLTASMAASSAVQLHGARGCLAGSAVERHFRDAKIMEIIEGSTEIQQVMIARYAAGEHRARGQS